MRRAMMRIALSLYPDNAAWTTGKPISILPIRSAGRLPAIELQTALSEQTLAMLTREIAHQLIKLTQIHSIQSSQLIANPVSPRPASDPSHLPPSTGIIA